MNRAAAWEELEHGEEWQSLPSSVQLPFVMKNEMMLPATTSSSTKSISWFRLEPSSTTTSASALVLASGFELCVSALLGAASVFTVLGNVAVIALLMRSPPLRTTTNSFIISLSAADLVYPILSACLHCAQSTLLSAIFYLSKIIILYFSVLYS